MQKCTKNMPNVTHLSQVLCFPIICFFKKAKKEKIFLKNHLTLCEIRGKIYEQMKKNVLRSHRAATARTV